MPEVGLQRTNQYLAIVRSRRVPSQRAFFGKDRTSPGDLIPETLDFLCRCRHRHSERLFVWNHFATPRSHLPARLASGSASQLIQRRFFAQEHESCARIHRVDLLDFVLARVGEQTEAWQAFNDRSADLAPRTRQGLADCAEKQRLVERYQSSPSWELLEAIRLVALVYYDHPDYDPAWWPTSI